MVKFSNLSALLVDDDEFILIQLRRILDNLGFKCTAANTVHHAKEILDEHSFDLVMTDIRMPNETGLHLISHIRMHPTIQNIPIIVLSSEKTSKIVMKAISLGATDYILKPINSYTIVLRLRKLFLKLSSQEVQMKFHECKEEIQVQFDSEIMRASKTQGILTLPLRLETGTFIELVDCKLFQNVKEDLEPILMRVENSSQFKGKTNQYTVNCKILNLSDKERDRYGLVLRQQK